MSDAIDELKIEITAESKKADDKIDDLCNKIGKLASSLGSLGGKKPTGLKDFQKATEGVSKAATDLASKYKDLGKGFELKGSTQYLQKQVDNLSNALARATLKKNELEMSGSTSGQMYEYAVRDVIKYENQIESLKNQFASISETKLSSELELKLSNLEQVESQIKEIVEETPRVVEISADSFGYNQDAIEFIENYSERAKTSVQSLTEKLSELTVPEVRTDNIDKLTASIEKTEVKLEELRNKLSNAIVMGTVTESVDDSGYIRLQEQIALTEKQLEAFRAKKAEVESAPSTGLDGFQSKISKIGASLSKVTSGFARFASGIKSVIAKIASLGKSMLGLNKHTKGLNNSLSGGLKHLLAYGLGIRSLYALFNKLRNAIKEGMNNLVQFDSETNASMSLLTNSLTQLKNATAAAVSPLLNALAPALNTIIQWCVSAANAVNQLIAALIGKSTWIKAKTLTDDYASSLDNAASSAKKLYNAVLPIDELNINSGETDTSGGSSGTSAGDMFEYEDISAKWANIADWLKSMWENADFTELGKLLGEKLKEALDNIDWESIKETARKIGKSIATFINGFVEVEGLGYSIGKTIAEALNTALEFLNSFAENLHWDSVGEFIAEEINGFFENFDFVLLAETLNEWVDGIKSLIISFLNKITWSSILKGATDFLGALEIDTVEVLIGAFLLKNSKTNLLSLLGSALLGKFTFSVTIPEILLTISSFSLGNMSGASFQVIGSQILEKIEEAMANLLPDWLNTMIGEFVAGFSLVGAVSGGNPFAAFLGGIIGSIPFKEEIFDFSWAEEWFSEAVESFKTAFDGNRKDWLDIGSHIFEGIIKGLLGAASFVIQPIHNLFMLIWNAICDLFGIHSPAEEMKPLGEYIFLGITEGFSSMFETFTETMTDFWENYILPWFTLEKWYELGTGILEGLQTKWEEIKQWWSETAIFEWWENDVKPWFTVEKWSTMLNNIKTSFSTKWSETVTQWKTNIKKWWDENVQPWFTKERWLALGENLKNGIYEGFKGLANKVVDVLNNVISALESMINSAISGINDLLSKINESGLGEFIGLDLQISNVSFGRIPHFSVGGFPEDGLFYANHNELVGEFSNGKTAVANNEQITEGIKQGVKEAVAEILAPYLSEIAQNTRETADKDFDVSLDGRSLLDGLNQRSLRNGYSFT